VTGGTLYIGQGKWRCSGTVTIDRSIAIVGSLGTAPYNASTALFDTAGTWVISSSTTDTLFNITAPGVSISNLTIANKTSTTATSSIGIVLSNAGFFRFQNSTTIGFYDLAIIDKGGLWTMEGVNFINYLHYGIKVSNSACGDCGDWSILGCSFSTKTAGTTHIRYESSGGGKIIGNKFNWFGASAVRADVCIDVAINLLTSDLIISGNSFENYLLYGIKISPTAGFGNINITGNQFAAYAGVTYGSDIYVNNTNSVNITGNIFTEIVSTTSPAISINSVSNYTVGQNTFASRPVKVAVTSSTVGTIQRQMDQNIITDGTSVLYNVDKSNNQLVTIGGNRAISFSGGVPGDRFVMTIIQDGTGGWVPTFAGLTLTGANVFNTAPSATTQLIGTFTGPTSVTASFFSSSISMTTTQLTALGTVPTGTIAYNSTLSVMQYYTGSAWAAIGSKVFGNSASSTGNTMLIGDNIAPATAASRTKVVQGNTSGNSEYAMGQDATHSMFFYWNYNATAASAYGAVETYANNNPLLLQTGAGKVGIGMTSAPTARFHLPAGTATANTAPLKLTSGTSLTTPEAGAVEFDGTNYFATSSTTRYTLAKTLTNTATLDFSSTAAQTSSTLTITVTGAVDGDVVYVGVPNAAQNANSDYSAYVSATNTVTVRFSNYSSSSIDPASASFRVSVIKY
jgi:hypothetical protein